LRKRYPVYRQATAHDNNKRIVGGGIFGSVRPEVYNEDTISIEKAFDTTWHSGLLYKLSKLEFSTSLTKLIGSQQDSNFHIRKKEKKNSGHGLQPGLDTKTDRLTDRQSQCDLDLEQISVFGSIE
jgi:hypothetical protein